MGVGEAGERALKRQKEKVRENSRPVVSGRMVESNVLG